MLRRRNRPLFLYVPLLEQLESRHLLSASLLLSGTQQVVLSGANVNISNDPNLFQSEMQIATNPANPLNLIGFSHTFLGDYSFVSDSIGMNIYISNDGGNSWAVQVISGDPPGAGRA